MAEKTTTAATSAAPNWPRHLARLSMIAAVLCFLSQVGHAQLTAKEKDPGWTARDRVAAGVGISLLISGAVLGAAGLAGAVRTKNYDTGVIAVIGLVINVGVLTLLAWYMLVIRPTLPL